MKYCTHCGTQCADEAAFCSKCGKELCDPAAATPKPSDPPEPPKPAPPKPFYKRLLTLSIFVSVIIIIIYSIKTSYENYDEAEYFEEHYQTQAKLDVQNYFDDTAYTVSGFTVDSRWNYTHKDSLYETKFVTEVLTPTNTYERYWCTLTYEFIARKVFVLEDMSVQPFLYHEYEEFYKLLPSEKNTSSSLPFSDDPHDETTFVVEDPAHYKSGQYKVGKDIPAGVYMILPETWRSDSSSGYFSVTSDANGDDIIFNDYFTGNSIIEIRDGEFLKLSSACAYPYPCEHPLGAKTSDNGFFVVGVDITPGEYKLEATGSSGSGYYSIYSDLRHDDIIANDFFYGNSYITVASGQYLKLSDAKIIE